MAYSQYKKFNNTEKNYCYGVLVLITLLLLIYSSSCYQKWMYKRFIDSKLLNEYRMKSAQLLLRDLEAKSDDPMTSKYVIPQELNIDKTPLSNYSRDKFSPRESQNQSVYDHIPERETLVLIPNRVRSHQEQVDYWLQKMGGTEFSVDDDPDQSKHDLRKQDEAEEKKRDKEDRKRQQELIPGMATEKNNKPLKIKL